MEFVLKKARKEIDGTIVNLAKLFEIPKSSFGKYIKKYGNGDGSGFRKKMETGTVETGTVPVSTKK